MAREHGERACYLFGPDGGSDRANGCHCDRCRIANNRYASFDTKRRRLNRDSGLFARPYIDAGPSRARLLALRAAGVGRRTVHDRTGLAVSVIARIANGDIRRVRRPTETAILAVTADVAPGSLIPAGPTWLLIDRLTAAGVTKTAIGKAITGNPNAASLQLRRDVITARSAARVAALAAETFASPAPGTAEHFRAWRESAKAS
jgi:hypothetical protein